MNPQEKQMLDDFLGQLAQVRDVVKDPEADQMIGRAVARQPDAAYLLVQRALLTQQALDAAKAQIASLQNQLQSAQPAAGSRSFLDGGNAWGNSQAAPARAPVNPGMPAAVPPAQAPYAQAQGASPGVFGGRAGSFLGSAAATAAGIAGGAFLFQGLENLFGHRGSGLLGQAGMNPMSAPVETTTVNNYYGDDAPRDDNSPDNTLDDVGSDDSFFDDSGSDDSSLI